MPSTSAGFVSLGDWLGQNDDAKREAEARAQAEAQGMATDARTQGSKALSSWGDAYSKGGNQSLDLTKQGDWQGAIGKEAQLKGKAATWGQSGNLWDNALMRGAANPYQSSYDALSQWMGGQEAGHAQYAGSTGAQWRKHQDEVSQQQRDAEAQKMAGQLDTVDPRQAPNWYDANNWYERGPNESMAHYTQRINTNRGSPVGPTNGR